MKLMLYGVLVALVGLSVVVSLQFRRIDQARHAGRAQTCSAWEAFDQTLIAQVRGGEALIPTLTYYKQHPDEAAVVLRQDEALVQKLVPPAYC